MTGFFCNIKCIKYKTTCSRDCAKTWAEKGLWNAWRKKKKLVTGLLLRASCVGFTRGHGVLESWCKRRFFAKISHSCKYVANWQPLTPKIFFFLEPRDTTKLSKVFTRLVQHRGNSPAKYHGDTCSHSPIHLVPAVLANVMVRLE